jgi:hypothetical protein
MEGWFSCPEKPERFGSALLAPDGRGQSRDPPLSLKRTRRSTPSPPSEKEKYGLDIVFYGRRCS